ncbi:hypothetical protein [Nocardioides dilutus]
MTTPAMPPFARAHHVPEAVYGLAAAVALLGANAAGMAVWWWGEQGTSTPTRTWMAGILTALLVGCALSLMVRHPMARRAAVGALALAVVADAILVGYQLAGLR